MEERKHTLLDKDQIAKAVYQEETQAQRVHIVSGDAPPINVHPVIKEISIPTIIKEMEQISVPVIVKETEVQQVNVPLIIKELEVKEIGIPTIIKETQVERIEIPVPIIEHRPFSVPTIVKEIERFEVPVIQHEYRDLPIWIRVCIVAQILATTIMLLKHII